MRYRELGQTGLKVSEIGFGAWGIGGGLADVPAYGATDDQVSKQALKRAYQLGVNFYDTSDLYGYGHSEKLIGETFKGFRDDVVITTKVGFTSGDGSQDFSPENIERSLDASLKRLQMDYVDLYQLHSPTIEDLERNGEILVTLQSLSKKGKARALGISTRSPNDAMVAVTKYGFKALEVNFNLVDQRAAEIGLFDACYREHAGVVARTPLCFGFLTGAYSSKTRFDATDHRSGWSAEQIDRWSDGYRIFCSGISKELGQTAAQIALRFCLSYPAISSAIPGMLKPCEVEENVQASELGPFSEDETRRFEQMYQENTFFVRR